MEVITFNIWVQVIFIIKDISSIIGCHEVKHCLRIGMSCGVCDISWWVEMDEPKNV